MSHDPGYAVIAASCHLRERKNGKECPGKQPPPGGEQRLQDQVECEISSRPESCIMNKNFDQRNMNTGRGTESRLTRLPHRQNVAAGIHSSPRRAKTGPDAAWSPCLCQLTSDGLVVLLIFFSFFTLISTEVIRHFKGSKYLSSSVTTAHLPRFRWCPTFPRRK